MSKLLNTPWGAFIYLLCWAAICFAAAFAITAILKVISG
jgi:hypothetical protein